MSITKIQGKKKSGQQLEWPQLTNQKIANAGEGVEKREHSYTVGENANWFSHYGKQYGGPLKN